MTISAPTRQPIQKSNSVKDYTMQHFEVGEIVSAKNRFPWLVYPVSMTVTRIRRNKYGRVSYGVNPGIVNWESGRKHDWLLLEEIGA